MKSYCILIYVLLFSTQSCSNENINKELNNKDEELNIYLTGLHYKLDSTIVKYLDEFIDSVDCEHCFYFIYFDKIEPHRTVITISAKSIYDDNLDESNAILYFNYSGYRFYLINGIESYFDGDFEIDVEIDTALFFKTTTWQIIDSFHVYRIVKGYCYPFFPSPTNTTKTRKVIEIKE